MTRRSSPQRIEDDRAFPIRISIVTPWNGFGQRIDVYLAWLAELGPDGAAWHSGQLYFRDLATASTFLANFPEIILADSTHTRSRPGRAPMSTGLNIMGGWNR